MLSKGPCELTKTGSNAGPSGEEEQPTLVLRPPSLPKKNRLDAFETSAVGIRWIVFGIEVVMWRATRWVTMVGNL